MTVPLRPDSNDVARTDRITKLLLELKDYPPAHRWARETIELWVRLRDTPAGVEVTVPGHIWPTVRDDVLATTGYTPWTHVDTEKKLRILFAGRWITPEVRTFTQESIKAPEPVGQNLLEYEMLVGMSEQQEWPENMKALHRRLAVERPKLFTIVPLEDYEAVQRSMPSHMRMCSPEVSDLGRANILFCGHFITPP